MVDLEKLQLGKLIDLVHRRTRMYLKKDNMSRIVLKFSEELTKVTVILISGNDLSDEELASIGARYNHMFEDKSDFITIQILSKTNHYKSKKDCYTIWKKGEGFVGNPRLWNT